MYYYLFYKLYKMSEAAPSRWASDWKAGVTILVLEMWLIASLTNYYKVFVDRSFQLTKVTLIIAGIILGLLNCITFVFTDTWKNYVDEFELLPKRKNNIGGWVVFSVVMLIILNVVYSYYLLFHMNK